MAKFKKLKTTYSSDHCAIATVQLDNFNPSTVIKQIDYSNLITENSDAYNQITQLTYNSGVNSGVFPIERFLSSNTYNLDFFITEKLNKNNIPVFYTYELMFDAKTYSENDVVQVFKNNVEKMNINDYILEFGESTLYYNLVNTNDPKLSRYGSDVKWGIYDSSKIVNRVRILLPLNVYNKEDFYTVRYIKNYLNVDFNNHLEIMELNRLYNEQDYFINNGNLKIITDKIKSNNLNNLYIVKNPESQIEIQSLVNVAAEGDQSNANSSWNLKVKTGKFITSDSNFNTDTSFYQIKYSSDESKVYQPLAFVQPRVLGDNIFQILDSPIYIEGYTYPDYKIDLYPNMTTGNLLPKGSIGVNLNNNLINEVYISSIDRYKGYMLFNKSFNTSQDVAFFAYADLNYNIYIRNLELNPRISGLYGISSNSNTSFKDVGIAVRKYNISNYSVDPEENTSLAYVQQLFGSGIVAPTASPANNFHPYFFDYTNPTVFYRADVISSTSPAHVVSGYLSWNPYTPVFNPSGEFIPIGLITLNELSPEVLTITDARVIAGGLDKSKLNFLKNNENNSFVDVGYVDGELLPYESLKIIHLPSKVYPDLIDKWKKSGLFNPNLYSDISSFEIESLIGSTDPKDIATLEYYNNLLQGKASNGDVYKDPYQIMLNECAEKEASYYLDRMIKKYLSAGMQYILLDENFKEINLRLDSYHARTL